MTIANRIPITIFLSKFVIDVPKIYLFCVLVLYSFTSKMAEITITTVSRGSENRHHYLHLDSRGSVSVSRCSAMLVCTAVLVCMPELYAAFATALNLFKAFLMKKN